MRLVVLLALSALLADLVLFAACAHAQHTPARRDFIGPLRSLAASRSTSTPCHDVERPETANVPSQHRAKVVGRQITLPEQNGTRRQAAFVLVPTNVGDANNDPARRLFLVVLHASSPGWSPRAQVEVPLGDAPHFYEYETHLRIARLEDVDDDGEEELFVVLSSDMAVECGTGHCFRRRTLVFDLLPQPVLTANVRTGLSCEAGAMDTERASTSFVDTNGDGHRDLVRVSRFCEGDLDGVRDGEPLCHPGVRTVYRWLPSDRYDSPRGG